MFEGQPATTPPHPKPQTASREEKMLHDFVEACRGMADKLFDTPISPLPDDWAEDERLWDILDIIGFAFDYQLPNTGVERMIKLMRELSGGTVARINALPLSWKTLVKEATLGVDTSNLVSYKFKVPEGLPVKFDEIPFIVKSTKAIMQEMLFDVSIMKHGDFFFSYPKAPGNCRARQSTHGMMSSMKSLACTMKAITHHPCHSLISKFLSWILTTTARFPKFVVFIAENLESCYMVLQVVTC